MTFLSDDEVSLLRNALGLGGLSKTLPLRNALHPAYAERYPVAFKSLMDRGYLRLTDKPAKGGDWFFYAATDAGRVACLDARWKT